MTKKQSEENDKNKKEKKGEGGKRKEEKQEATELMKAVAMHAPVKKKMKKDFSEEELREINEALKKQCEADAPETVAKEVLENIRREKIIKAKRRARELEKGNRTRLVVFPSFSRSGETKWYKMTGVSALYYVYRMAARMGRKATLLPDSDKFARVQNVASICGMEKFIKQVAEMEEFDRHEVAEDGIHFFYFKHPLSDDELGALRRTERELKDRMHAVIRPKNADPDVYQAVLAVGRQLLPRMTKIQKGYAVTIGSDMVRTIHALTEVYFDFAKGYAKLEDARRKMLLLIEQLRSGLAMIGECEALGYDAITSIGANIVELENLVCQMK